MKTGPNIVGMYPFLCCRKFLLDLGHGIAHGVALLLYCSLLSEMILGGARWGIKRLKSPSTQNKHGAILSQHAQSIPDVSISEATVVTNGP